MGYMVSLSFYQPYVTCELCSFCLLVLCFILRSDTCGAFGTSKPCPPAPLVSCVEFIRMYEPQSVSLPHVLSVLHCTPPRSYCGPSRKGEEVAKRGEGSDGTGVGARGGEGRERTELEGEWREERNRRERERGEKRDGWEEEKGVER